MLKIPESFKGSIDTEWKHYAATNTDVMYMRFSAGIRGFYSSELASSNKDELEERATYELYALLNDMFCNNGTCRVVESELCGQMWVYCHTFLCDCGQRNLFTPTSVPPKHCPNCGRKVE